MTVGEFKAWCEEHDVDDDMPIILYDSERFEASDLDEEYLEILWDEEEPAVQIDTQPLRHWED